MTPRPQKAPIDPLRFSSFAYATGYNREGKRDGDEFVREAKAWNKIHGGVLRIGTTRLAPVARRRHVEGLIREAGRINVFAFFGHGLANSYPCTGHNMATVEDLVREIVDAGFAAEKIDVILYSCSAAAGKRGFADVLSNLLFGNLHITNNVRVWARTASQHTTRGPDWELAGGPSGGQMVIPAGHSLRRQWIARLRDDVAFRLSWWKLREIEAIRDAVAGGLEVV